jgi:c-di-GMP-binding flagellar brake protein YcgR
MYPVVNQNILIDIIGESKMSRSIVADVGEKEILISCPIDGNIVGLLPKGAQFEIIYMSGSDQYKFTTEILGRKKDNIPLFRIKKPHLKEIKRIQRRENFRVNANLSLSLNESVFNTINISAGGVLFSCKGDYVINEGELLPGIIVVPNINTKELTAISFQARVTRIFATENPERNNVALEYTELNEQDQMKIIQYCFEKQKKNRLMDR